MCFFSNHYDPFPTSSPSFLSWHHSRIRVDSDLSSEESTCGASNGGWSSVDWTDRIIHLFICCSCVAFNGQSHGLLKTKYCFTFIAKVSRVCRNIMLLFKIPLILLWLVNCILMTQYLSMSTLGAKVLRSKNLAPLEWEGGQIYVWQANIFSVRKVSHLL